MKFYYFSEDRDQMSFIDLMNLVSFGGPVNEKFGESIANHVQEI